MYYIDFNCCCEHTARIYFIPGNVPNFSPSNGQSATTITLELGIFNRSNMANPQTDDGYTMLSNDILEALGGIRIPGEARQIFDIVLRKTYGFKKKEDKISLSQFALSSKINRPNIVRAIQTLLSMNLIIKKDNEDISIYSVNKDFDTWKPLSKKITLVSKKIMPIIKKDNTSLSKKIHTKENNTKETFTKENIAQAPEKKEKDLKSDPKEISEIIKTFIDYLNPHLPYNNTTQRIAVDELIQLYGFDRIRKGVVFLANAYKTDQFMPRVTTPYELKMKWAKILLHVNSKRIEEDNNPKKGLDL